MLYHHVNDMDSSYTWTKEFLKFIKSLKLYSLWNLGLYGNNIGDLELRIHQYRLLVAVLAFLRKSSSVLWLPSGFISMKPKIPEKFRIEENTWNVRISLGIDAPCSIVPSLSVFLSKIHCNTDYIISNSVTSGHNIVQLLDITS